MRYFVYVDEDGTITWSPGSQNELFKHPRDGEPLMNSHEAVARIQTALEDDFVWELVGNMVAVSPKKGRYCHTASLEPNTLHEVSARRIVTQENMQRGKEGFEPIPTAAVP